jgi:cytochrome c biogenesis protein CcdA/thiol-disulfide isomerase/thioredoxin
VTSPLLLMVGFLAGLLTIVSPCILPVLPAVIAAGVATGGRRRALAIATGLALAFGLTSLFSIRILEALGLPLGLRYDIAIVVLFLLAAGFLIPQLGQLLERPFARLGISRSPDATGSGFMLGATLGLLYLPCGGPILAAISAVGAKSGSFGLPAIELTVAYSLGIALPIFGLVLLTGQLTSMTTWLRTHATRVRQVGGVLLAISALLIAFGAATSLQTAAPAFTASIENKLAGQSSVSHDLTTIKNPHETEQAKKIQQSIPQSGHIAKADPAIAPPPDEVPTVSESSLHNYGQAPNFANVTHWLNTPDGSAINLDQLRGKVVLIDFWTYSCINCLRSLPHIEAWYNRYHRAGLDVIGVHTPEFDFEHEEGNVQAAVKRLGVDYPVAMDNDYGTWTAWGNNSWPAEYLIDAQGNVRYGDIGEGSYGETEAAIRALLSANGAKLPPVTSVPDRTPTQASTPESYLGYQRLARYDGTSIVKDQPAVYTAASSLGASHLTYNGQWTVEAEDIVAGSDASLKINTDASNSYLVLSGSGTVTGTLNDRPIATQHVSGVPTLYTLTSFADPTSGVLTLNFSPGLKAYDFTFG